MKRRITAMAAAAYAAVLAGMMIAGACGSKEQPAANTAPPANANGTAPAPAPEPATPAPAAGDQMARAQQVFNDNCSECHLESGKGDAHHKKDEIPDFTNAKWQARESDDELFKSIQNGKGDVMPAFKDELSEDQIRALVSYVRSFASAAPAADAQASKTPERSAPAKPKPAPKPAPQMKKSGGEHAGHP